MHEAQEADRTQASDHRRASRDCLLRARIARAHETLDEVLALHFERELDRGAASAA